MFHRDLMFPKLRFLLGLVMLVSCGPTPGQVSDSADVSAHADSDRSELAVELLPADLRKAVDEPDMRQFYEANGWKSAWTPQARTSLKAILADRRHHGLDRIAFLVDPGPRASAVDRELAYTRAALSYAEALSRGIVDPAKFHELYTIPRPAAAPPGALAKAVAEANLQEWFAGLAPSDADYAKISTAYVDFSASDQNPSLPIPPGVIRPGDTDDRIPAIVAELTEGNYLVPDLNDPDKGAGAGRRYTGRVVAAVRRLQRDYGIAADGIIGPDTLKLLNLRPGDQARALAVALERLRWLSRAPPPTRIDVNTAAARLTYFRDGTPVDTRRVIVGRTDRPTPQLLAPMYRLVANPTWTVPKSIERSEMAGVSRGYLRRHNMVRRNGWIVQRPGPGNALGVVKFDLRDKFAIYLHDTSARGLFSRSERHLSHGCVRVDDAVQFALRIADDQGVGDEWRTALKSGQHRFVNLPREIPVRLLYHNAFVDSAGAVAFRLDPYGWNAPIARLLGFGQDSSRRARSHRVDVGP